MSQNTPYNGCFCHTKSKALILLYIHSAQTHTPNTSSHCEENPHSDSSNKTTCGCIRSVGASFHLFKLPWKAFGKQVILSNSLQFVSQYNFDLAEISSRDHLYLQPYWPSVARLCPFHTLLHRWPMFMDRSDLLPHTVYTVPFLLLLTPFLLWSCWKCMYYRGH